MIFNNNGARNQFHLSFVNPHRKVLECNQNNQYSFDASWHFYRERQLMCLCSNPHIYQFLHAFI